MASGWSLFADGINLFASGFSLYNQWKSNKVSEDYYNAQIENTTSSLEISKANLELQYEQLRNNYVTTLNDLKSSKLSTLQSRDSYLQNMSSTELTLEKLQHGEGGIEYYNALLARWQDNYDYQLASTKREAKASYDSLMSNYTGTEVMNAEAGRAGKTAELLEKQQKQNVEAFVGKDMKLDAIGGIYSQTLTELSKDLNADKHTYMTQLGILGKSMVAETQNLQDYRTNLAEIDEELSKYNAQIQAYEDYLNGKELNLSDIENAYNNTKPGDTDNPPSTDTNPPSETVPTENPNDNNIEDNSNNASNMDALINGTDTDNHAGTTSKDWSSYTLKNNDISNNLSFAKNNPDRVITEVLDASNIGTEWKGVKLTDDNGNSVEIYMDSEGNYLQYGIDKDGNKTVRLTAPNGAGKTYKAEEVADVISQLSELSENKETSHKVISAIAGLTGGVGLIVGGIDLLVHGISYLNEKNKTNNFNSIYQTASEQAAQQVLENYSGSSYTEQTQEEVRAAAQEAGNSYYIYGGKKYDTATGELYQESTAIQEGLDSGKYKYDEYGYVVDANSSSTPQNRTTGGGTSGSYSSLEERVAAESTLVNEPPTIEERVQANIEASKTSNRIAEMLIGNTTAEETQETTVEPTIEPVIEEKPPIVKNQTETPKTTTVTQKAEEEAKKKAEAEAKAKAEQEAKAKAEAEAKAKQEAEERARIAAEREAEEKRQAEEAARAKQEAIAQRKAQQEALAKAREEAAAKKKAEAEAKAAAEAEAKRQAELAAKAKAEEEYKAQVNAQTKANAEKAKNSLTSKEETTESKLTAYFTNNSPIITSKTSANSEKTSTPDYSQYSPAIQEGLKSGKYKIDEYGYVVSANSSSSRTSTKTTTTTTTNKSTSITKTTITSKKSYSARQ